MSVWFNMALLLSIILLILGKIRGEEDTVSSNNSSSESRDANNKYPEAAAVHVLGQFTCSGTLVSERVVVTAAVCIGLVPDLQPSDISVVVGSADRTAGLRLNVSSFSAHPEFRYYPLQMVLEHDIAVLILEQPTVNSSALEIYTNESMSLYSRTDQEALVVGWGADSAGIRDPQVQAVHVTLTQRAACAEFYGNLTSAPGYTLAPGLVCVLPAPGLCIGESGAGVRVRDDSAEEHGGPPKWQLAAVAGPTVGCPAPRRPEIFTAVAPYLPWIRDVTRL